MLFRHTAETAADVYDAARPVRRRVPMAWAHSLPARALRDGLQRAVVFPLLRRLAHPVEVRGLERLEALDGPAVLVANHPGHLDPVVLTRALSPHLRRRLAVAAAEDALYQGANRPTGLLASLLLGAFPIPRHGRADEALRRAGAMLDAGRVLLIFPEGKLSPGGAFGRCRTGAARLAAAHGVPVVPVYLDGAYRLDRPARLFRRARVRVTFGAPLRLASDSRAAPATARIQASIAELGQVSAA
jgi:1-acyl-sn-glycerol-3-phosphate acyltransferase